MPAALLGSLHADVGTSSAQVLITISHSCQSLPCTAGCLETQSHIIWVRIRNRSRGSIPSTRALISSPVAVDLRRTM